VLIDCQSPLLDVSVYQASSNLSRAYKFQEIRGYSYAAVDCLFVHELNSYLLTWSEQHDFDMIVVSSDAPIRNYLVQMSFDKAPIIINVQPKAHGRGSRRGRGSVAAGHRIVTPPNYVEVPLGADNMTVWIEKKLYTEKGLW